MSHLSLGMGLGLNKGGKLEAGSPWIVTLTYSAHVSSPGGIYGWELDATTGLFLSNEPTLLVSKGVNYAINSQQLVVDQATKIAYFQDNVLDRIEGWSLLTGQLVYQSGGTYNSCTGLVDIGDGFLYVLNGNTTIYKLSKDLNTVEELAFTFNELCYGIGPSGDPDYPLLAVFAGGTYSLHKSKLAANDRVQLFTGLGATGLTRNPRYNANRTGIYWGATTNTGGPTYATLDLKDPSNGNIIRQYTGISGTSGTYHLGICEYGGWVFHTHSAGVPRMMVHSAEQGGAFVNFVNNANNPYYGAVASVLL